MLREGFMLRRLLTVFAFLIAAAIPAQAQDVPLRAPTNHVEAAQLEPIGQSFDAVKATNAYLATVNPKDKARSDAYVDGGYGLMVVDLVYTLVVAGLLLWFKISARMRDLAASMTRSRFWQVPIYVVQYVLVTTVVGLPLAVYEGFTREHQYGLSNQTLVSWAGDYGIGFLQSLIGFVILLTVIYAVARAVQRGWWMWGTIVSVVFLVIMIAISPVYLAPMFNHYSPLPESATKNAILSLARSQGIPANNVYTFDASRQSKRISANVSGLFGTTRISLNDNLLNRCTPTEVIAVLGHEMGHYVMNHVTTMILQFGLVILIGFWFVDRAFHGLVNIFGGNWDVRTIDDPAGLPLVVALVSFFFFVATPVTNTIIRTQEVAADIFGLDAVRQPDAFARVTLKVGEYRKLDPTPLEEMVFFDHPSGRTRIYEGMRWKAEHLHDPDIVAGPVSPQ
jgi:STE24 endopeptidase